MGTIVPRMGSTAGNALFGSTRQEVLRLFFAQADRRLFLRQVIRALNLGSGAVQREIARLTEAGILTRTVEGRQTYFQANTATPIFEELQGIVRKTFGTADVLRNALQPIADRITVAFIFGSVAAGTENASSDIDLMIVGKALNMDDVLSALDGTQQKLCREVNPTVFAVEEFRRKLSERRHFVSTVAAGPKIYLIGGESELQAMAGIRVAKRAQVQPGRTRGSARNR